MNTTAKTERQRKARRLTWEDGDVEVNLSPKQLKRMQADEGDPIGLQLRALRQQANLTQVEVAQRMKVEQNYVSRLERQDNIKYETLDRYLQAIGAQLEIKTAEGKHVPLAHAA